VGLVGLAVRTKVAKLPIRAILAILAMLILATLPIKVLSKLLLLLKVAKMAKEIGLSARARARVLELCFQEYPSPAGFAPRPTSSLT
jgi:hypothetical protein